ncbi:unnamed protein product [Rotaria magnacalcarata]|uniref:Uncharacterized protein n=1 Tax=Rotaria magnacalcarata TaxID=392030 RepID=A0A816LQR6_9BILA|nr:unnamed protein product [Rotaria magnacalcarata]CAF3873506.1 unnamed protein product [Rotaria magnacalcarata]
MVTIILRNKPLYRKNTKARYQILTLCDRLSTPALSNHPGRAALISSLTHQSASQNISNRNRLISSSSTTASSPAFTTIEPSQQYSLSQPHSEQPSTNASGASTPSTSRRASTSDTSELPQRDSTKSNSSITASKSLLEWHEQPVDLSEQPPLPERGRVHILSPNTDRTAARFFVDNDLASLMLPNGVSTTEETITKTEPTKNPSDHNEST